MVTTPRARNAQDGFTLIEVMVAILLTVIAVIGIVGLYRVETRSSSNARHTTEAATLAEDQTELLRTVTGPVGGAQANIDERGLPGGIYTRTWTVVPDVPGGYDNIVVTVTWPRDDDNTQTSTLTARSRRLP
jgi:Tfp pilus assembly protein PilV